MRGTAGGGAGTVDNRSTELIGFELRGLESHISVECRVCGMRIVLM